MKVNEAEFQEFSKIHEAIAKGDTEQLEKLDTELRAIMYLLHADEEMPLGVNAIEDKRMLRRMKRDGWIK